MVPHYSWIWFVALKSKKNYNKMFKVFFNYFRLEWHKRKTRINISSTAYNDVLNLVRKYNTTRQWFHIFFAICRERDLCLNPLKSFKKDH